MKKIITVFIFLLLAQPAFAKFTRINSDHEIFALEAGKKAYCVVTRTDEGLKLQTEHAIKKPELRKAMRSNTYFNRTMITAGLAAGVTLLGTLGSLTMGFGPEAFVQSLKTNDGLFNVYLGYIAIDGTVTSSYDDHSPFAYNAINAFGMGERLMRGRRIKNFISSSSFEINDKRFFKIIKILPSLKQSKIRCDEVFDSFVKMENSEGEKTLSVE